MMYACKYVCGYVCICILYVCMYVCTSVLVCVYVCMLLYECSQLNVQVQWCMTVGIGDQSAKAEKS